MKNTVGSSVARVAGVSLLAACLALAVPAPAVRAQQGLAQPATGGAPGSTSPSDVRPLSGVPKATPIAPPTPQNLPRQTTGTGGTAAPSKPAPAAGVSPTAEAKNAAGSTRVRILLGSLTVFVLAVFLGFELIAKVPPTLHTPLMSGSNAISGITIVGALVVAGAGMSTASVLGFFAVVLATINVVGGFLVTHRMLIMFSKR